MNVLRPVLPGGFYIKGGEGGGGAAYAGATFLGSITGRTGGDTEKLDSLNAGLYVTGQYVEFDDEVLGIVRYKKVLGVLAEDDPAIIVPDVGSGAYWLRRL